MVGYVDTVVAIEIQGKSPEIIQGSFENVQGPIKVTAASQYINFRKSQRCQDELGVGSRILLQ